MAEATKTKENQDTDNFVEVKASTGASIDMILIDGSYYPVMTSGKHLAEAQKVKVRDDDIWITSYLKTGTHWTWEIVNMIMQQAAEISKESCCFLEIKEPANHLQLLEKKASPRVVLCQLPVDKIPQQLLTSRAKIIYCYRNPKDVLVSHYHMYKTRVPTFGSWSDWFQIHVENQDKLMNGGLVDHVYGWMEKATDLQGRFLPVMFEDTKKNPGAAIQRIAEYLGYPLSPQLKSAIVEKTDIRTMKPVKLGGEMYGLRPGLQTMFFRKGEVGGWKSEFTVAQNETMDAILKANPRYKSLSFTYSI